MELANYSSIFVEGPGTVITAHNWAQRTGLFSWGRQHGGVSWVGALSVILNEECMGIGAW